MVTLILWAVAWASDVPAALATGEDFSCKQIRDTVWCWGNNEDRQLGVERSLPMSVEPVQATLTGAVDLSASSVQACAVTQSGELVCWGQALKASWGQGVLPQRLGSVGDAAGVSLGPGRGCIRHRGGGVSCWETNRLAGRFEGVQQLFGAEQLAVGAKTEKKTIRTFDYITVLFSML